MGDYALCSMILDCLEAGVLLGQILAPLTQYQVGGILLVARIFGHHQLELPLCILNMLSYLLPWNVFTTGFAVRLAIRPQ